MRNTSFAFYAAVSLLAASFAACSDTTGSLSTLPVGGGALTTESTARSPMQAMSAIHPPIAQLKLPPSHRKRMGPDLVDLQVKEVAIADVSHPNSLELVDTYGHTQQRITNDVNNAIGMWFDSRGNLYSAQYATSTVEEYNPGQLGAAWTYSSGVSNPVDVTTDSHQNVYITNFFNNTVQEFAHRTSTPLHTCSINFPYGVTVDSAGNVYVFHDARPGYLVKFAGGLGSCSYTTLTPSFSYAGGLKMDKSGNLIVADQLRGIDILRPPYTSVYKTITGFCDPTNFALNPPGYMLFVVDSCYGVVDVLHYPSGIYYTTLYNAGYANGVAAR